MSSQGVINDQDDILVADFLTQTSLELFYNLKFSYGKKMSVKDVVSTMYLADLLCSRPCYLSDEDLSLVKQNIIKLTQNARM